MKLAFFLITILPLVCTPGPDILFVTSQGLAAQHKGAFLATIGICAGYLVHALLATLGVAAVVAASPILFDIIRWIGAAYLFYLGVRMLASAFSRVTQHSQPKAASRVLRQGMFTSLLNPKGLLFFLALLPQFVDRDHGTVQILAFALIFVAACFVVYLAIGLAVAAARKRFAGHAATRAANGIAGTVLIALGVRLALIRA